MLTGADIALDEAKIVRVCGGYKRPADQLKELHRQGFYRARRARVSGRIVLERAHYEAVCSGQERHQKPTPKLRMAT